MIADLFNFITRIAKIRKTIACVRAVVTTIMRDGNPQLTHERWLELTTGAAIAPVALASLFPQTLFDWASQALLKIF